MASTTSRSEQQDLTVRVVSSTVPPALGHSGKNSLTALMMEIRSIHVRSNQLGIAEERILAMAMSAIRADSDGHCVTR